MPNPAQGITSTAEMVADLQQRLPMGLGSSYCMLKLNQAYAWIEQQGAFVWNIKRGTVTLTANTSTIGTPDDMDVGKPCSLYPLDGASAVTAELPYVAMDEVANHQIYHLDPIPGIFSCYTIFNEADDYSFRFAPLDARHPTDATIFQVLYHMINPALDVPKTIGDNFFPTPPAFDQLIVDLAEAEIRRNYRLSGWADAVQRSQASAALLLDKYRSPKRDLAGIAEQTKEVQEKQLNSAQAG